MSTAGKQDNAIAAANNFSIGILKRVLLVEAQEGFTEGNISGSPLSITVFLNLLTAGMKGNLLDYFLELLGSGSIDELNDKSSKLIDLASFETGGPILLMGNGIWVDQRCTLKPYFQRVAKRVYGTEAQYRDFENGADDVTLEVNSWLEEKTKGLIKEMSQAVDAKRLIVLENVLYFKGDWEHPFDELRTEKKDFYLLDGRNIQVPFMRDFYVHRVCGSFEGFKVLKLPYASGEDGTKSFSMYFFLPDERDGLQKLINKLSSDPVFLNQNLKLGVELVGKLKIPKFKFYSDFNGSAVMYYSCIRVPRLRDMEIMEIGDSCERQDRPMGFVHRVCIEVNEKGTEAVAVTSDDDLGCSLYPSSPPRPKLNFIADHPFLFMISEDNSKVPFFIGAIVNPLLTIAVEKTDF